MFSEKEYSDWTRQQLLNEIIKLKKRRRYGVVWEDKKEVLAELCKEKLPVLSEVDKMRIQLDKTGVNHYLIEGDNYHALSVLNYTHPAKIDIIYIDPPYNTGNKREWKYNDQYVSSEDEYKHSKWLSFMSKRLLLAKDLLTEKGLIFISIDDNELAQLKLLCDDIFGQENFITNFIRKKKSTSTNVRGVQVSAQADYILCYGRTSEAKLNPRIFEKENRTHPHHDKEGWYRTTVIEKKNSGGYRRDSMQFEIMGIPPREGKRWQIGEEKARELEKMNRFVVENGVVKLKIYDFEERDTYSAQPNLLENLGSTDTAQRELDKILGKSGVFENPKPVELIKHIITISEKNGESIILDFFAGSGTTGHAVLEMNKEDGGKRKFILCTNNEDNNNTGEKIATDVCYPRLKNVMTGYKPKDEEYVTGFDGNLRYYQTDFVENDNTDANKKKLADLSTDMLCLTENCFTSFKEGLFYRIFTNINEKYLGIIYDDNGIEDLKQEIARIGKPFAIYVFSLDKSAREEEFEEFSDLVELKPIPETILNVYRRLFR